MRIALCWCILLAACAAHDPRCESRLEPINPPASIAAPRQAAGAAAERAAAEPDASARVSP